MNYRKSAVYRDPVKRYRGGSSLVIILANGRAHRRPAFVTADSALRSYSKLAHRNP